MTKTNPYAAGARGLCSHCGEGYLFDGFLKIAPTCEACGFDLGKFETGDGAATFVILKLIDMTIGLRVPEREEVLGLDSSQHGELAYRL